MSVDLPQLLDGLEGVRRSGRGWIACCPAHVDRSPSLSICRGRDGRILLHCFAGCTVEQICAALGGRVKDLFASKLPKTQPPILRDAQQIASEGLRHHVHAVREEPVTVIFTTSVAVDTAIARALALTVEGELCQIAVKE